MEVLLMRKPNVMHSLSLFGLGLVIAASPVLAQQARTVERRSEVRRDTNSDGNETRSSITVIEDGKERKMEIVKKDGKVYLNGKPLEEASQDDRSWYDKHVFEDDDVRVPARLNRMSVLHDRLSSDLKEDDVSVFVYDDDDTTKNRNRVFRFRNARPMIQGEDGRNGMRIFNDNVDNFREPFAAAFPKGVVNIENFRNFDGLTSGFAFGEGWDGEVARLEGETRDLARDIRNAKEEDKANLERKLDEKLNQVFEKKQEARRKEIERLQTRLRTQQEALDSRERARRDMIERRKQELLGKTDPLRW
jgi:hypothetical protein